MWYQSLWFTLLIVITSVTLAFFAFILHTAKKRAWAFIAILLIMLVLAGGQYFYTQKYRKKIANFKAINYHFISLKDLSDFEADKYSASVVVDSDLTKAQLRAVVKKATNTVLRQKKDASIIWLAIFDSENADFAKLDESNPSYVAQTQWKRKAYNGPLPDSFVSNEKFSDYQVFYNKELTKELSQ